MSARISSAPAVLRHQLACDAEFRWNKRKCIGTALHCHVLNGNYEDAIRLAQIPGEINRRYTYETEWKGKVQVGSGQAIHLAVSRNHFEIAKYLLANNADVHASVERDKGVPYYQVIHAAVYAEGTAGDPELVKFLLKAKSDMDKNLDGKTPLHLAYQIGATDIIDVLQTEAIERASRRCSQSQQLNFSVQATLRDLLEMQDNYGHSPLEIGFRFGKMQFESLTEVAPITPTSLRVFVRNEPRCIPIFMEKALQEYGGDPQELVRNLEIDMDFVADLFGVSAIGGLAVLNAATGSPVADNPGWHAVPTRVSMKIYMQSCYGGWFRRALNPDPDVLSFYEEETTYSFDSETFKYPEWHDRLSSKKAPCIDVDVQLCYVADLISAQLFVALAQTPHREAFDNDIIRSLIDQSWWRAAWKRDMSQVSINFWSLVLISIGICYEPRYILRACQFVGARGVAEFVFEMAEFWGCVKSGNHRDYCTFSNLVQICVSIILIAVLFDRGNKTNRAAIVLILWMRCFNFFRCAEHICVVLMPIQRSVNSIKPALLVTMMFFFALAQSYYVFAGGSVRTTIFSQFGLLFTGDYPSEQDEDPNLILLLYFGLLVFTIGLLNIFITVIGEAYTTEKETVRRTFYQDRAEHIKAFLLRASVIRADLIPLPVLKVGLFLSCAAMAIINTLGILFPEYEMHVALELSIFLICMFMIQVAPFQDPNGLWLQNENKHYIWLARPHQESMDEELEVMNQKMESIMEQLDDLHQAVHQHDNLMANDQRRSVLDSTRILEMKRKSISPDSRLPMARE